MAAPFRALPPGVYFNPTAEECVRDYLKPWAAGLPLPPSTDRVICDVDVCSDSPGALLLAREPGFSRGFDHKWLMLSRCGGTPGRGKRVVATGAGSWQSEQTPKGVVGAEDGEDEKPFGGRRRCFGFYVGKNGRKRGEKTPWLMEEFTALEDGHGHGCGGGDGTFVVFCRIYLSPRLEKEDKEKKRQILGDHMVAFDRNGQLKTVRVLVSPEFFAAAAQGQFPAPPRVLGFQQDQPARRVLGHPQEGQPPPPPAPRVLGHQQVQPGAPPPAPRVLGHQQGQAAATPAVLGGHHGGAMLPRAVPGHHDGQAVLPSGVPAHHHGGHAAAAAAHHQVFLGSRQGQIALQQQMQQLMHILAPFYNQEASPSPSVVAGGHCNHRNVRLVDPQQGEGTTHTEKKPRLSYGSPAPQPRSSDSATSSCVVHISPCQEQGVVIQNDDDNQRSAEPVATTTPPPQEIPGTATAGSAEPEPPCDVSAPAPAEVADDAGKTSSELMLDAGIYMNFSEFEAFSDIVPGFDEFQLRDLLGY